MSNSMLYISVSMPQTMLYTRPHCKKQAEQSVFISRVVLFRHLQALSFPNQAVIGWLLVVVIGVVLPVSIGRKPLVPGRHLAHDVLEEVLVRDIGQAHHGVGVQLLDPGIILPS